MNKYPRIFLIIAAVLLVFLLILYSKMETIPETPKRVRIQMVSDSLQHELTPYPHQQTIYGLQIEISGNLDGNSYLCFRQKSDDYSETVFLKKGKVDHKIKLDWDSAECIMGYYPVDAQAGELLIRYRFFSAVH